MAAACKNAIEGARQSSQGGTENCCRSIAGASPLSGAYVVHGHREVPARGRILLIPSAQRRVCSPQWFRPPTPEGSSIPCTTTHGPTNRPYAPVCLPVCLRRMLRSGRTLLAQHASAQHASGTIGWCSMLDNVTHKMQRDAARTHWLTDQTHGYSHAHTRGEITGTPMHTQVMRSPTFTSTSKTRHCRRSRQIATCRATFIDSFDSAR